MSDSLFVVFGAGQIGSQVAERLLAAGHRVRQVRRSGTSTTKGALEVRAGDLTDLRFAGESAEGARALIHCAVPPYHQWAELLEKVNDGVLHAATTSKAPLVVMDNLYGYGRPDGPMKETSPVAPISRKGALRAKVAQKLLDAHRAGQARVAIARAADFYGPGVTLASVFGERFIGRALAGKGGECFGPPDLLHSYSYGADVAAGLVTLASAERAWGEIWHLPVAPAESTRAVVARFGNELGTPLSTSVVPGFVLHLMGLFVPAVKEMLEMRYQWQVPFVLDDAKFRAAFGETATSLEEGVRATVKWMRLTAAG
ncbi:MAG: NAD-dependent epimerase/dehydratase family protein [Archangium sp.]|nr:NAD-dependent epimerase/dehydratase family protein [Archangium sp.]